MVKKFIALLLFLCLLAPFAITYTFLRVQKHQLKRNIKHTIIKAIDKNELVLLRFSIKEATEKLDWEHSKEFEFEGEMYDVVEKRESKDSVIFWCWWDNKETMLNRQLAGVLLNSWQQNDNQKQQNDYLIQYTKNWLSCDSSPKCPADKFSFIQSPSPGYLFYHINFLPPIPTPPPRV